MLANIHSNDRVNFSKLKKHVDYPDLLEIQIKSFKEFMQLETPPDKRKDEGLHKVFQENFPISDRTINDAPDFIRGMVAWIGGRQVAFPYDRKARAAGETKYPLSRMVRFAVDAITGFSVVPLMASMTIGWGMAVIGFAFALYSVVGWAFGHVLPGWTSLMAAIGILGGMQFLMLGVIGAYLGRLYDQSKDRPLFMIRDIVGGPSADRSRRPCAVIISLCGPAS